MFLLGDVCWRFLLRGVIFLFVALRRVVEHGGVGDVFCLVLVCCLLFFRWLYRGVFEMCFGTDLT